MNNILSEKEYQHFIMERLEQDNGYVIRKATSYDRLFAMDREMLFQFLNDTQPEAMEALRKIYKADLEDTIVSFINAEATKARGSHQGTRQPAGAAEARDGNLQHEAGTHVHQTGHQLQPGSTGEIRKEHLLCHGGSLGQ